MRAAIYLRVSTEEQAAEAHSIDAQRRECAAYAHRRGWQIVAEYVDPGVSGRTMTRPGMERLLADAEREELLHAIVERVYVENGSLVAVEPREPFYPLLVVSSGVSSASDGRQAAIRHHRIVLLPPQSWRRRR